MDDALMSHEAYAETVPFPIGAPNEAYAEYFVGQSYLLRLTQEVVGCAHVTFEPGRRPGAPLHWRTGLVSRVGAGRQASEGGRCSDHTRRHQTLARRGKGPLVLPYLY